MSLFLLSFFFIYGGAHLYAFLRARQAFALTPPGSSVLALFFLFMVLAPLLVRVAERHGLERIAQALAYTGYVWMAVLFLFFASSIAVDCYRLLVSSAGLLFRHDLNRLLPSSWWLFVGPGLFALLATFYGYFEARDIRSERLVLPTRKLPAGARFTIAQLSDVHVGLIIRRERLARMAAVVEKAAPDIIVSTGDLVDGQLDGISELASVFRQLNPRYGKFAVTGNHEHYAGLPQALAFTSSCGFRILRGEAAAVTDWLTIAGVDDYAGHGRQNGVVPAKEAQLLGGLDKDRFTILLKHRPIVATTSRGAFDLQLSGHVHKGQLFPFNLLTYLSYPVRAGLNRLPEDSLLYVNRGTGTWGPPIRFLAPPEVTIIELVSSRKG